MRDKFIVAIDFDGVITNYKKSKGYSFTGKVRKEAIKGIKELKKEKEINEKNRTKLNTSKCNI